MIIQTGMRTDIPAFYPDWLMNRIQEGYVLVRNPYNPVQVTKYSLSKEVVDLIAFCTKNPEPMLIHMDTLKRYGQYWFVTITPKRYGSRCQSPKRKCLGLNPRSRRAIKSGRNTRSNSLLSYSGDHRTKGNRHITFYHRFTSSCNRRVRRFSLP